jgi:hypothetical protein
MKIIRSLVSPHISQAIGFALSGAAMLGAAGHAYAQRAVGLSFQEAPTYGRIVAKWVDGDEKAPVISASIDSQVLVIRFDQKIAVDVDALSKGLPSWAAVARLGADEQTIRVGLKQTGRARVSTSVDMAAIDLVPDGQAANPPALVSPLVKKKAAEAEAKRVASLPPPPPRNEIEVRASERDGSSRVALYWPGKTTFKVISETPGEMTAQFSRQADADLAYLKIDPPDLMASFDGRNTDKGYQVTIRSKDELPIRLFMDGDTAVFDISVKEEEPAAPAPAKQKPAAETKAPAASEKPPATKAAEASAKPPASGPIALGPKSQPAAASSAAAPPPAANPGVSIGGADRQTVMNRNWRDPAPRSGVVDIEAKTISGGIELQFPFPEQTAAAVFQRGTVMWAVFAAGTDIKLDPASLPSGYRGRTMRSGSATMLRLETPKGVRAYAEADGGMWTVRLASSADRAQRFLKPQRRKGEDGRALIETLLPGAAGIVWLEDPVVGDQIAAVVSYGPSSSSPTPFDFVEASLPATAHGLAISPKSDDAVVTLNGERVLISLSPFMQTAGPGADAESSMRRTAANPGFIDFAGWGGKTGKAWYDEREKLEHAVERSDLASAKGGVAMMDLARFLIGHELGMETVGLMNVAAAARPELEQDPEFLALRGAANVLAHRLTEADKSLSAGPLRGDASAALWRGLSAARRDDWERAVDHFRQSGSEIYSYTPDWSARFAAAWAEAALNTNDFNTARRKAEEAIAGSNGKGEDAERGRLVLASVKAAISGPAAAYDDLAKLSKSKWEAIAVKAELKRLEAAAPAGKLTPQQAAEELETLRYRWRGDGVEMATVGILADQYMGSGRFREALQLAHGAALMDASAPGARQLRIRLTDYFRRLFLQGEADRLDPIQSLALFYEFSDLTPVGADGDLMVRRLAQRLVAFDLLGPAAQLLKHQVDNRMRGASRSIIAIDLATIYLLDRQPDRALATLNSTRIPGLPKDVLLQRRTLEAAAYRDLGRYDHAIELMEGVDHPDAKLLLADAYMRDRKWTEAARTWLAMLPPAGQATAQHREFALKAAISARMARDAGMLAVARTYTPLFADDGQKASFDLITSQADASGAALSEAVRALGDASRVDAFAASMMKKLQSERPAAGAAAEAPAAGSPAPASSG